jgi:hypothetical protein
VLGDQIYIAALVELAGKTQVGRTWLLDRTKVMLDLAITDLIFDEVQKEIETRMPGKWDRAVSTDRNLYVYMRLG